MDARLKYSHAAPEGLARLRDLEHYLNTGSGLESVLQELVRLLASQLNGCEYCVGLHTAELKKHHETAERIEGLLAWRGSELYTHRERAALGWAEAVTNIQTGHAPDAVYDDLRTHFSETEIANLTLTIATINAWNRMEIALGARSSRG